MNVTLSPEERISRDLKSLFSSYGYSQYRMSKFEEYDLYVRNKDFLVSDNVITFTDTTGKLLALKPDVTLSIVKNEGDVASGVRKLFYSESVYRISERTGAFREIPQTGLECLGDVDGYHLSEVLTLAAKALSLISEDFVLDVSHLGLLRLAMEAAGVADADREDVLTFVSQKNRHDLASLLSSHGADPAPLLALIDASGDPATVLPRLASVIDSAAWKEALDELSAILSPLPASHVRVDFSVIHDLSYYNGIVFGGFVAGVPECVLSGGQYDRLMERLCKSSRAVGFAVYPDRLDDRDGERALDADTVILYSAGDDPARVSLAVEKHVSLGERVVALREIPEAMTYGSLVRLTDCEVSANG